MGLLAITIATKKGGVGRTTTTLSLASAWAKEGLRVLCIDGDPQHSLSSAIWGPERCEATHPALTLTALFDPRYDPEPHEIIHQTGFENLWLLPATDVLEEYNAPKPWEAGERQRALCAFLRELQHDFDICLLDQPPNTAGLITWASLAASTVVVSPVLCDPFGTQSVIQLQRLAERVQTSINPALRVLGYFINMRQRNAVMDAYEHTLRQVYGSMILQTVVPLAAAYRQSVAERTPIMFKKGNTAAHKIIRALADEMTERVIALNVAKEAA